MNKSFNDLTDVEKSSYLKERRKPEHKADIIAENLALVKSMIAASVNEDTFIIQTINTIEELDSVCNTLIKRVREWYGYYFPELSEKAYGRSY